MNLFSDILNTYCTSDGKGIPIGALTSQHIANLYLDCFDHWIKEGRRVKGYVRYMDDFLVFGEEKPAVKNELERIDEFLRERLALSLKHNIQLNRCTRGIPFLGYRVFPHTVRLSAQSKKRYASKFRKYEGKYLDGDWSLEELARRVTALAEFVKQADAFQFRKSVIKRSRVVL